MLAGTELAAELQTQDLEDADVQYMPSLCTDSALHLPPVPHQLQLAEQLLQLVRQQQDPCQLLQPGSAPSRAATGCSTSTPAVCQTATEYPVSASLSSAAAGQQQMQQAAQQLLQVVCDKPLGQAPYCSDPIVCLPGATDCSAATGSEAQRRLSQDQLLPCAAHRQQLSLQQLQDTHQQQFLQQLPQFSTSAQFNGVSRPAAEVLEVDPRTAAALHPLSAPVAAHGGLPEQQVLPPPGLQDAQSNRAHVDESMMAAAQPLTSSQRRLAVGQWACQHSVPVHQQALAIAAYQTDSTNACPFPQLKAFKSIANLYSTVVDGDGAAGVQSLAKHQNAHPAWKSNVSRQRLAEFRGAIEEIAMRAAAANIAPCEVAAQMDLDRSIKQQGVAGYVKELLKLRAQRNKGMQHLCAGIIRFPESPTAKYHGAFRTAVRMHG